MADTPEISFPGGLVFQITPPDAEVPQEYQSAPWFHHRTTGQLTLEQTGLTVKKTLAVGEALTVGAGVTITSFSSSAISGRNQTVPTELAVKTFVDAQVKLVRDELATGLNTKAALAGSSEQVFAASELKATKIIVGTTAPQRNVHFESGEVHSGGAGGGYSFSNRGSAFTDIPGSGERWVLYANGGTARLWSGSDKLSVTASGNLGIGTTSPQRTLHVRGNAGVLALEGSDHSYIEWYPDGFSAGRKAYMGFPGAQNNRLVIANEAGDAIQLSPGNGNVLIDGNVAAFGKFYSKSYDNTWQTIRHQTSGSQWIWTIESPPSDARLKADVAPLAGALATLDELRPVAFSWADPEFFTRLVDDEIIASPTATPEENRLAAEQVKAKIRAEVVKRQYGFIAQELEQVFPDWVGVAEDGYKRVKTDQLVAFLVQAVKELKARYEGVSRTLEELRAAPALQRP